MVNNGRIAVVHFVGRIADGAEAGTVFDTSDVDVALSEEIYHGHRDYKPSNSGLERARSSPVSTRQ